MNLPLEEEHPLVHHEWVRTHVQKRQKVPSGTRRDGMETDSCTFRCKKCGSKVTSSGTVYAPSEKDIQWKKIPLDCNEATVREIMAS